MALHVYIADGFADDCDELMHRCLQEGTLTFEAFTHIWQDMQLSSIYEGRNSGAEIAELSEEVIYTAKHYLVAKTENFEASVAGLFLVYSLLNLQPFTDFAHLRIVPEDLPALERLENIARRDRRLDVLYILGSVLIKGPVHYQAVARERGMEGSLRKYLEGYTALDRLGVRPKGVFSRQNEEMDLLRELNGISNRYSSAKSTISGAPLKDRNLCYVNEDMAKDLESSLKKIVAGFNDSEPEDSDSEESDDGYRAKNIKYKAMSNKVKGMGHLIGVQDKTNSKPEVKLMKDKSPPSKKKHSKQTKSSKSLIKTSDVARGGESDDVICVDNNNTNDENQTNTKEQVIEIEIDNLPRIMRSGDGEKTYEIEIIDHQKSLSRIDDEKNKQANGDSKIKKKYSAVKIKYPIKVDKKRIKNSRAKCSLNEVGISDKNSTDDTLKRVDITSKKAKIDNAAGSVEIDISDIELTEEEKTLVDTDISKSPTTSSASRNVCIENKSPRKRKNITSLDKKDKYQAVDGDLSKKINEVEICSNEISEKETLLVDTDISQSPATSSAAKNVCSKNKSPRKRKNITSLDKKDKYQAVDGDLTKKNDKVEICSNGKDTAKNRDDSVKDKPEKIKGNKGKPKVNKGKANDKKLSGESSHVSKNKSNAKHDFVKPRLKRLGIVPVDNLKRDKK